ncbi:MAG: hypothetical protein KGM91_23200 [Burkholderiales bacterium]|nr:hypothetical protein [Burkholderiales bacterium]
MTNFRMLSPAVPMSFSAPWGEQFVSTPGTVRDVDEHQLPAFKANGWIVVAQVGTSAERPGSSDIVLHHARAGSLFVDTHLGALIVFDGRVWRNPMTGAATDK